MFFTYGFTLAICLIGVKTLCIKTGRKAIARDFLKQIIT